MPPLDLTLSCYIRMASTSAKLLTTPLLPFVRSFFLPSFLPSLFLSFHAPQLGLKKTIIYIYIIYIYLYTTNISPISVNEATKSQQKPTEATKSLHTPPKATETQSPQKPKATKSQKPTESYRTTNGNKKKTGKTFLKHMRSFKSVWRDVG